ncbi:amino acid adenylation domain-containing protein [Lewinella marina]|uniref:Carrier domain-containing protein n=1 Tax=Neolewinella marina TaxID=438751 RepID=A0A2G0CDQ1_9BACT|nr:non-ribosomal peptide synthetase [Neolewinella marina]NJB85985.1 amino acid adenylation domain-containing protein [Neolewinella marina]PHK98047.1 hypothetical protein CGL56_12715 [Neolewinella marina]
MNPAHLTTAQLMLWTGQQLAPRSPQYNSVFTFELHGPLDTDRFRRSFGRLVEECDNLRTVFSTTGGEVRQQVLAEAPRPLEFIRWSQSPASLEAWVAERGSQLLDLAVCCYDAVLVELAPDHHLFFLNQHHLIVDAWGVSVQYRRLSELYAAGAGAVEGNQPPGFRDYRRELPEGPIAEVPDYWSGRGAVVPPQLFGRDNTGGESRSPRVSVTLPDHLMRGLDALAAHPRVRHWTWNMTAFSVLSALLTAYVYRLTRQRELALGTPAAHRATPAERDLPGMLIEMLPLYGEVRSGDSFLQLIERQKESVNAFLRAARPGVIRPELAAGYNVVLNYITATFGDFAPDVSCRTRWHSPGHADPGHHLRLQVHNFDGGEGLTLEFDLNVAVFTSADRERVPAQFLRLLEGCLEDPERSVDAVDLLDDAEKAALCRLSRGAEGDAPAEDVLHLFEARAAAAPGAIALAYPGGRMTYGELDAAAGRLAGFLDRKLAAEGQIIAIHLPRCADLLVAILGCWKAGHTYLPLPADIPDGRLDHILRETEAALIITDAAHGRRVGDRGVTVLHLDEDRPLLERHAPLAPARRRTAPAYVMYTSGSTGVPKGVVIGHAALANYIDYARRRYVKGPAPVFPLFTTIGFDLTVTSLFTPLVCGGRLEIYPEPPPGTPDLAVVQVMEDDRCDVVKLTPSHLALLRGQDFRSHRLRTLIVGGEQFAADLAREIREAIPPAAEIINEYGPTEATVGCIVQALSGATPLTGAAVPIGRPIPNTEAWILDGSGGLVLPGTPGDLYLGGVCLAEGYWKREDLTADRFLPHPFAAHGRLYRTGDRARWNAAGELEFLGRQDRQVKWRGYRIELDEVENLLAGHPAIMSAAVELVEPIGDADSPPDRFCTRCGLPANYPSASFDAEGVCQLCRGFADYEEKARAYFRTPEDFRALFADRPVDRGAPYDCIMLLSGGKDSTYVLGQLVDMGLTVLAFTLDNGYISDQAIDNIRRVTHELGVDVHFGSTPAMNEIFVDSLQRHCNVCNGCFKTIYTLSTQLALEKGIPYIVTGLSRGQFFETRLTEELFWQDGMGDSKDIDAAILEARKAYHRADDAVSRLLDTSAFADDRVFERVQFLDFYRYTDVTLEEMYAYLDRRLPWVRPTDTGRSTNCLINQVGIHVHKKEKGYNNYAFPYSWDVRIGHKDRAAALEEINEEVDVAAVERIMQEIGYFAPADSYDRHQLLACYTAAEPLDPEDLRAHLRHFLPDYSLPQRFIRLEEMPLTPAGKVDRRALAEVASAQGAPTTDVAPPEGEIEALLAEIWGEVLGRERIGRHERFIDLGGHSLTAIRLAARISDTFELEVPLHRVFELPTIAQQASYLEETMLRLLAESETTAPEQSVDTTA